MKTSFAVALLLTLAAPVIAQGAPPSAQPPLAPGSPAMPIPPPAQGERQAPPPPPPAPPPASERRPLPTRNVKVDVTIAEQSGAAPPVKKVVTLVVADGRASSVRSVTSVPIADGGGRDLPLNIDATVNVTAEQRIVLELRFNYASSSIMAPLGADVLPAAVTDVEQTRRRERLAPRLSFGNITENLTVLLTSGAPMVVARSADAAADRTVTVEVKAEIVK